MPLIALVVNIKSRPYEGYDVYIGRGTDGKVSPTPGSRGYFGNPFELKRESEREFVIQQYRHLFEKRLQIDPTFKAELLKLRGLRLGCFCKPKACHGDVIVEWLNGQGSVS